MIALWSLSQPRRPTMDASNPSSSNAGPARQAWNKGKLTGPKPPLRLGHVWSIRARLQLERRTRDLALFNLAIDSKLRGCDLVAVRVDDVAPNGYAIDRATVRQRKTGRPVRFELTEVTRQAVDDYLRVKAESPIPTDAADIQKCHQRIAPPQSSPQMTFECATWRAALARM